jgi:hypothetical protein
MYGVVMSKLAKMIALLLAVALVAVACDKPEESDEADEATAEAVEEEAADEEADEQADEEDEEELAMVEVADDGVEFDPPVQPEQIPDGAWYCDMGTVEYAAMQEGDGSCPVCGMKLKQKPANEATAEAEEAEEGHEGHNH